MNAHAKRSFFRILLVAALLASATAFATEPGWYITIDAGRSHFDGISQDAQAWISTPPSYDQSAFNVVPDAAPCNSCSNPDFFTSHGNDNGYRLQVGYQFNANWGLEGGYVDFGSGSASGTWSARSSAVCQPFSICTDLISAATYSNKATYEARGWVLALAGTLPLGDRWSVFADAGAIDAHVKLHLVSSPSPPSPATNVFSPREINRSSTEFDPTLGVGLNWMFATHWGLRLGWDRYFDLGERKSTGSSNIDLASIGTVYHF